MAERPYLILTLRRTGGTSFTSFLQAVSSFPRLQHEPLNRGRIWGEVTRRFNDDGDRAAVEAGLAERLEDRPNIKHCIEMVPRPVTTALIRAAVARDYRVFLLTRNDEAGRLKSLFLAEASGAWGPKQAAAIYPKILAGAVTLPAIAPRAVHRRHASDAADIACLIQALRRDRVEHDWLVFEEIYESPETARRHARAAAAGLGIEVAEDDPRLDVFSAYSGQGSSEILAKLPNHGEFAEALAEIRESRG